MKLLSEGLLYRVSLSMASQQLFSCVLDSQFFSPQTVFSLLFCVPSGTGWNWDRKVSWDSMDEDILILLLYVCHGLAGHSCSHFPRQRLKLLDTHRKRHPPLTLPSMKLCPDITSSKGPVRRETAALHLLVQSVTKGNVALFWKVGSRILISKLLIPDPVELY